MTTVLVDRKNLVMAADRQSQLGNYYKFKCSPKIARAVDCQGTEWLYASAGCAEAGEFFNLWFEAQLRGETDETLYPREGEFCAYALNDRAELYFYGSKGAPIQILEPMACLGSGGDYALGCYMGGNKDYGKCIGVAAKLDPGTGKGVQIERLTKRAPRGRPAKNAVHCSGSRRDDASGTNGRSKVQSVQGKRTTVDMVLGTRSKDSNKARNAHHVPYRTDTKDNCR